MAFQHRLDLAVKIGPSQVTAVGGSQLIGVGMPRTYFDVLWGTASGQGNQYYLVGEIGLFGGANGSTYFEVYQAVTTNLGVDVLGANPSKVVMHQDPAGWASSVGAFALNGANIELRVTPAFNAVAYARVRQLPSLPWALSP